MVAWLLSLPFAFIIGLILCTWPSPSTLNQISSAALPSPARAVTTAVTGTSIAPTLSAALTAQQRSVAYASLLLSPLLCIGSSAVLILILNNLPPMRSARRERRWMRERWAKAYYCARCAVGFVPGQRQAVAPGDFKQFLKAGRQ